MVWFFFFQSFFLLDDYVKSKTSQADLNTIINYSLHHQNLTLILVVHSHIKASQHIISLFLSFYSYFLSYRPVYSRKYVTPITSSAQLATILLNLLNTYLASLDLINLLHIGHRGEFCTQSHTLTQV